MTTPNLEGLSPAELRLHTTADQFSKSPRFRKALDRAMESPESALRAVRDPRGFLTSAGIKVPTGLSVEFFLDHPPLLPGPDYAPFMLILRGCRQYWVRKCEKVNLKSGKALCTWRQESVCFGFQIIPRPLPPVA